MNLENEWKGMNDVKKSMMMLYQRNHFRRDYMGKEEMFVIAIQAIFCLLLTVGMLHASRNRIQKTFSSLVMCV